MSMTDELKALFCMLGNLFERGYGNSDETYSWGGTVVIPSTQANFQLGLSTKAVSKVHLVNITGSAIDVTYSVTGLPADTSPPIKQNERVVFDEFKGRLYFKGAGASIRFYVMGRH